MKISILIVALTILGLKWMDVAVKRPPQQVRVDTVRVETTTHDTVTVISRAADTVHVVMKQVGPLTEADLAQIICSRFLHWREFKHQAKKQFWINGYGSIGCPLNEEHIPS